VGDLTRLVELRRNGTIAECRVRDDEKAGTRAVRRQRRRNGTSATGAGRRGAIPAALIQWSCCWQLLRTTARSDGRRHFDPTPNCRSALAPDDAAEHRSSYGNVMRSPGGRDYLAVLICAVPSPGRTSAERSLFVSRGVSRARRSSPSAAGVGSFVGSGSGLSEEPASGCKAGHAGLRVVPVALPGPPWVSGGRWRPGAGRRSWRSGA
jgi:hypothetical protein